MKIPSRFRVSVIAVLIVFSIQCLSVAQPLSVKKTAEMDAHRHAGIDVKPGLWFSFGCMFGPIGWMSGSVFDSPPPSYRLLGKSSEYIAFYLDAYKVRSRQLQSSHARNGCLISSTFFGLGMLSSFLLFD